VGFGTKIGSLDVNNDGTISALEENVAVVDNARKNPVNYDYNFMSYSLGLNYLLADNQSVYGRYSRGGAAKADRAIFPSGSYLSMGNPKDMINQAELGWKRSFSNAILYVTGFYAATTEEGGFEATTQRVIENDYTAFGAEIEGAYRKGNFDLRGAATYTRASITTMNFDGTEGANFGNTPRRQPGLMYSLMPSYQLGKHAVGLSAIGQTRAYAQDNNELVMPGYMALNGFVAFNLGEGLDFGINANNILNAIGITESEEGSMVDNQVNYLRARSITGRSISASLRYRF
jgi:outer membrane receptor protein involved in Fe transport